MKTIDDIKRELPEVRVKIASTKSIITCRTAGRKGDFCQVYDPVTAQRWEFSWGGCCPGCQQGHNAEGLTAVQSGGFR